MKYYVYIIRSLVDSTYYKGFSTNPALRLIQHNNGENQSTKRLVPWELVYIEEFDDKSAALKRERNLKKATRSRINMLIKSPKNILLRGSFG